MNTQYGTAMKQCSKLTINALIVLIIGTAVSGCGDKSHESKASQSLASVNGKEITVHQLNEELARANVQPAQKDAASKQILNALIDRQLLEQAALKAKVDRDPNVMQTIERAKSQIIAQAYLQSKVANISKPEKNEIEDFYKKNPQLFSERKLVEMEQLLIDSRYVNDELKSALGGFKTLQEVAVWLDAKGIQYDRGEVARSVAELPPQISERLKDARRGQLFVIGMGPRTMLVLMDSVKESPILLADATPQIEQVLLNNKRKQLGEAEIVKLRSDAKIEYLDNAMRNVEPAKPGVSNAQEKGSASTANDDIARGVNGLK
ncbi:EpsD family peptidyl-prolyl cis-trans isomerase [Methylobacillus caricis]|uniref:EpsD family peptidyl-prolyl cis-trans isomerase n=1 Tax=Methylobacillus caricis TaxID=1971611 RepID=UPI001CFFAF1F|nr:EpsD family peptidyl-prolyl cis-trans isomerase [Methylobacillus caricis]MCB5188086.1 EpsD family peptidyl-prolyl cis-trans isomerase [Methylobacillus caricis]